MTTRRTMPTLPDDAAGRLDNVVALFHEARSKQKLLKPEWCEICWQLERARNAIAKSDLETTADALVRVASLEQELLGNRDISGPLADEFEALEFERTE